LLSAGAHYYTAAGPLPTIRETLSGLVAADCEVTITVDPAYLSGRYLTRYFRPRSALTPFAISCIMEGLARLLRFRL